MSVGTVIDQRRPDVALAPRPTQFEIRTFGRFRIVDPASGAEHHFRSRKALALLCYLAVAADRALSRERAMELLWGSRGEEQARASLRQILHEIRSSPLGESGAIEIGRHHLAARAGAISTDLQRMTRLAESGDVAALALLMTGCAERMFEGLDGIDPALDDWLRVARQQQLFQLSQAVVTACAQDGGRDVASCRVIISALQRLNPCDEAIARLGFELDHASGDLAALHQRYRWLEAALQRDLDAEPSDLTRDLFRQLTRAAPVHHAPALPAPPTVPIVVSPMAGTEPPILALTPLELFSNSEEERVLASVLLGEIEYALSGIADLRLLSVGDASQDSLFALSASSISAYALKGSLRAIGEDIQLGWRLSRVRDGLLLWTHRTQVARESLGATLGEIVARVAGAVLPTLERDFDDGPIEAAGTSGYGIYLQGRARLLSARTIEDMRAAAGLFERAIAVAPRLVNAQLSLARLYNTDFEQRLAGHDRAAFRRIAFELCSRAVNMDPRSAHARARLGWCYMRRGDLDLARNQFESALALNPYHADCLNEIGVAFFHMGELDRAMTLLRRAFELNPFPRDDYFCDMAVLQMLCGDHARAEESFEIAHNEALHYAAFRLANRALMGVTDGIAIEALRQRFRAIWAQAGPPDDDDLIDAIFDYSPLQRQKDRVLATRGLTLAGLRPSRH